MKSERIVRLVGSVLGLALMLAGLAVFSPRPDSSREAPLRAAVTIEVHARMD